MAALSTVLMASVTGCGENGGGDPAKPSGSSGAAGAKAAEPRGGAPASRLKQERDGVETALDSAAAQARMVGLSPGPDPDATSPTERKLSDCTALWSGSTGRASTEASGDEPFATALRALEGDGWKLGPRQQEGGMTEVVLTKGEWTIRGKLSESDRIDLVSFGAYHASCAKDVTALPALGSRS